MRRKFRRINAVGIGTATLTATDGTHTATKEVEVANIQILTYLYSAITPSFTPVTGDMVDLSTGNKYIEFGAQKNGQTIENPIFNYLQAYGSSFWYEDGYPHGAPVASDTINMTEQEGITGPHGGPVYEISYKDPQITCAGFGTFRIMGDCYDVSFNKEMKYQICSPVTNVTINSGNDYRIPADSSSGQQFTIPMTYTQPTEDNLNPIFVWLKAPDNDHSPITLDSYFPTRDGQGAGTIGVTKTWYDNTNVGLYMAYADGTDIVQAHITILIPAISMDFNDTTFPVLVGDNTTWGLSYSPSDLNPNRIHFGGAYGIQMGTITKDATNHKITVEFVPQLRLNFDSGYISYWYSNGNYSGEKHFAVEGDGYELSGNGNLGNLIRIKSGETKTIKYKAFTYDIGTMQSTPVLQQSTVTLTSGSSYFTITSHTFDSTTGEGTLEIEAAGAEYSSGELSFSVTDPITSKALSLQTPLNITSY